MTYTVRQHYAMGEPTGKWEVRLSERIAALCSTTSETEARMVANMLNQLTDEQYATAAKQTLIEMSFKGAA